MPAPWPAIRRPGLVVCEGRDDERFLVTMLNHLRIRAVCVEYVDGESQFRGHFRALRTRTGFDVLRAIAVIRDADTDSEQKFRQTCSLLRDFGYPVPSAPSELASGRLPASEAGTTGQDGTVGILVLPTSRPAGALEDLCIEAIRGDPSLPCVDDFLACVVSKAGIAWRDQHVSKARLNVWLGSRPDPRRSLRDALSANRFPLDSEAFTPVREFLTRLAAAAGEVELRGE